MMARRSREPFNRLGFTHGSVSHRTENGIKFVELDLIEMQLAQKGGRKALELLDGFHQPLQNSIGIEFKAPGGATDAQAIRQARQHAMESGLSGNPTWMRRQMRTRATTRS